jgi:uncharacterized protein Yka (UPF0111/DUF47 family)
MLEKILESGEQRIMADCQEIIRIAGSANGLLSKGGFHSDPVLQKIHLLEEKSDRKVFSIVEAISTGSVAPNAIDNFMVLVKKEDDIVDSIYNLSREMCRYRIAAKPIEGVVDSKITELLGLAKSAIDALLILFSEDDIGIIHKQRHKVVGLEEDGDVIKDWLLSYAYAHEMAFKDFYYTTELAHKADDILDSCRSTADYFMNIMISLTT